MRPHTEPGRVDVSSPMIQSRPRAAATAAAAAAAAAAPVSVSPGDSWEEDVDGYEDLMLGPDACQDQDLAKGPLSGKARGGGAFRPCTCDLALMFLQPLVPRRISAHLKGPQFRSQRTAVWSSGRHRTWRRKRRRPGAQLLLLECTGRPSCRKLPGQWLLGPAALRASSGRWAR